MFSWRVWLYSQKWHLINLFYSFNKQEYFQADGLFISQNVSLDLQMTALKTWSSRTQARKLKMAELQPAVFRRQSFVSGEDLFQNQKAFFFFRKAWILNEAKPFRVAKSLTPPLLSKFRSPLTRNVRPPIRFQVVPFPPLNWVRGWESGAWYGNAHYRFLFR